jgi:hypothetical protein
LAILSALKVPTAPLSHQAASSGSVLQNSWRPHLTHATSKDSLQHTPRQDQASFPSPYQQFLSSTTHLDPLLLGLPSKHRLLPTGQPSIFNTIEQAATTNRSSRPLKDGLLFQHLLCSFYGGINFCDLCLEQGIGQITFPIQHLRTPGQVCDLLDIVLSWFQFCAGVGYPVFLQSERQLPHLEGHWLVFLYTSTEPSN